MHMQEKIADLQAQNASRLMLEDLPILWKTEICLAHFELES